MAAALIVRHHPRIDIQVIRSREERNGITTPLSDAYELEILRRTQARNLALGIADVRPRQRVRAG